MAKKAAEVVVETVVNVHTYIVRFADVIFNHKKNARSVPIDVTAPRSKQLLSAIVLLKGWDKDTKFILGDRIPDLKEGQESDDGAYSYGDLEEEMKIRQARWENLKASLGVTPQAGLQLACFEAIFTEEDSPGSMKRHLIVPTLYAHNGYCRSFMFPLAFEFMASQKEGDPNHVSPKDFNTQIVLHERHYNTALERRAFQVFENQHRADGSTDMNQLDLVRIGRQWLDAGIGQSKFEKEMNRGTGKKIYGIVTAQDACPEVNLEGRLFLSPEHPEYIPIAKLWQTEWNQFVPRLRLSTLEEYNTKRAADGKSSETFLNAEAWETMIRAKIGGTGGVKIMTKEGIKAIADGNKNPFQKAVALAIHTNNTDLLQNMAEMTPACQAIETLHMKRAYKQTESLLNELVTMPDAVRGKCLEELMTVAKKYSATAAIVNATEATNAATSSVVQS